MSHWNPAIPRFTPFFQSFTSKFRSRSRLTIWPWCGTDRFQCHQGALELEITKFWNVSIENCCIWLGSCQKMSWQSLDIDPSNFIWYYYSEISIRHKILWAKKIAGDKRSVLHLIEKERKRGKEVILENEDPYTWLKSAFLFLKSHNSMQLHVHNSHAVIFKVQLVSSLNLIEALNMVVQFWWNSRVTEPF